MVVLYRDQEQIDSSVNKLQSQYSIYLDCKKAIKLITAKEELISEEELNNYILLGTNFTDAPKVADLRGVKDAYDFYIQFHKEFDLSKFDSNGKLLKEVVEEIEKQHTTYLDKEQEAVYRRLEKVAESLNQLHVAYSKALIRDYQGKYSVSSSHIHTISNELSRSR